MPLIASIETNGSAHFQKKRLSYIYILTIEIYMLTLSYLSEFFQDYHTVAIMVAFYVGFGLILAFSAFQVGSMTSDPDHIITFIAIVRLSITINTLPAFVTAFERARVEEIGGMGKRGLVFSVISVYYGKLISLSLTRTILFIPFTAIVYPIVLLTPSMRDDLMRPVGWPGRWDWGCNRILSLFDPAAARWDLPRPLARRPL